LHILTGEKVVYESKSEFEIVLLESLKVSFIWYSQLKKVTF